MDKEKYYIFKIEVGGYGRTPQEAWEDAVENFEDSFTLQGTDIPKEFEIRDE